MSAKQIGITICGGIKEFTGLTADTVAWLAANTSYADGSTYRELDGEYRLYEIQSGIWYLQQ